MNSARGARSRARSKRRSLMPRERSRNMNWTRSSASEVSTATPRRSGGPEGLLVATARRLVRQIEPQRRDGNLARGERFDVGARAGSKAAALEHQPVVGNGAA